MNPASGESIEVDWQSGDEGLAFARGHFGDAPAMKHQSPDELNIEMNHGPCHRLVAHRKGVPAFGEAARGLLDHGKRLRKDFFKTGRKRTRIADR